MSSIIIFSLPFIIFGVAVYMVYKLGMIKCPTCEETRYIKNKGCTDTVCTEFEIIERIDK